MQLQVIFREAGIFEQLAQRSLLQVSIAVNRHGQDGGVVGVSENIVAAAHAPQFPTLGLQYFAELLPGDCLHNSISAT